MLFCSLHLIAQPDHNIQKKATEVLTQFKNHHYLPPKIGPAFNSRIGELLLIELDKKGFFFLREDSTLIMETSFLDSVGIHKELDSTLNHIYNLYLSRIEFVRQQLELLKNKGEDHFSLGRIYFSGKGPSSYKEDDDELLKKWKRYMIYSSYMNLFDLEDSLTIHTKDSTHAKFPKYWNETVEKEFCSLTDYDLDYEEFYSVFLECLAKAHDPHSSFFTYEESNDFFNSITTKNMSFGLYFTRNKNNNLEITYLIPGGSAWNSGELNIGDIIILMISGGQDTLDLNCIEPYDLIEKLDNSSSRDLTLKIKKQNGQIKHVSLLKSPIEVEENVIKSFILNDQIGYIELPGFYSNWTNSGSGSCSDDMAKELLKLSRDDIKGLIIDLRFNGGGSLPEAIDLCGIFINEGPLCVTHNNFEGARSIKDRNRGTIYDGPMIILVNTYSASASELFAGIMQDYNRAVIVGDTTFGKGSVQNIFDSDDGTYGLKITTEGFYSIDLKSNQKTGIVPDIVLPNYYYDKPKEEKEKFALDFPVIEKKLYLTQLDALPLDQLKTKSGNRIQNDQYFQNIEEVKTQIEDFRNNSYSIDYEGCKEIWDYFMTFDRFDLDLSEEDQNRVKNNSYDQVIIDFDETKKEANSYTIQDLAKDVYLRESVNILNDLLNLKK